MTDATEAPAEEAPAEGASLLGGAKPEAAPSEEPANPESEAKPEGGGEAKPEGETKEGEDAPAELDLSKIEAPEGFEMDEESLKAAEPLFKELGLNQEQAQKLVGFYAERVAAQSEAAAGAMKETTQTWVSSIKDEWGDKYDENVSVAAKAVQFGGDDLRDALNVTGAGNHPAVIKFFHRIGQQLSEDGFEGTKPQASDGDWVKGLYPSMQTQSGG